MDNSLTHTLTYWSPGAPDGYGGRTFSAPVEIIGRWEDGAFLFVNPATGKQEVSKSRIFTETAVELDGYLYRGTSTSTTPQTLAGAWIIAGVKSIDDLDDVTKLYTVYL